MVKIKNVAFGKQMKRDLKLANRRGCDLSKLDMVIDILCTTQSLPEKYRDHALTGNYKNYRECHIEPDWLLIYKIENSTLTLVLFRTGTHSDLFRL